MDKVKILIADDVSSIRSFIHHVISQNYPNVETEMVTNGLNAKKKLENNQYDLVLCDWEMPQMNGIELLKWIRNHPTLNKTPFVMITANGDKESVINATRLGATAYILKPLTMDQLMARLATILSSLNRRHFERLTLSGNIYLQFRSGKCEGSLLDISKGGLMGMFKTKSSIPQIQDKLMLNLRIDDELTIEGLYGFVTRIQLVESTLTSGNLNIALKLLDNLCPEKKNELDKYIDFIQFKISNEA